MKKKDHILIARSLDGDLSEAQKNRLDTLLAGSDEAMADLEAMRRVRTLFTSTPEAAFAPGFSDRVLRRLHAENERRTRPGWLASLLALGSPRALSLIGSFAALLLFAIIGITLWTSPTEIEVRYGDFRLHVLPDGTRVELGSGSRLSYGRFRFSSKRDVQLIGEAYFDVAHGDNPFSVETFNARLSVEGTSFNVRAWPDDHEPETAVTVTDGRVRLESRLTADSIDLAPDQFATVADGIPLVPHPLELPVERALAWRTGGLTILNRTLGATLVELERRYNVTIHLADPALALERVTYLQPAPASVTDVLSDISYSKNLQFRPVKGGFEILRAQ